MCNPWVKPLCFEKMTIQNSLAQLLSGCETLWNDLMCLSLTWLAQKVSCNQPIIWLCYLGPHGFNQVPETWFGLLCVGTAKTEILP